MSRSVRGPDYSTVDRFWSKVDKSGDCWLWTGPVYGNGYGNFRCEGKQRPAHRVSFETTHGAVPEGLFIDHLCHTPLCVRPEHLRSATPKENQENRSGAQVNSKSGIRGVYPGTKPGVWRAYVRSNGKVYWTATFRDIREAEAAVIAKREEAFTPIRRGKEPQCVTVKNPPKSTKSAPGPSPSGRAQPTDTQAALAHRGGITRANQNQPIRTVRNMGDQMCNPTSSPPRREMYELEESMRTSDGPFFVPPNRRIRIGTDAETRRAFVYNANYMSDGTRYADYERPWTAFTAIDFRAFKTQPEALAWVLQEARK